MFAGVGLLWFVSAQSGGGGENEALQRHRNLGKAFYENPTTQLQAVEEFRKALALRPNSAVERLNYGLALLRAGKTQEGIAELEQVQKQQPDIPHTWFNLGIEYKKAGEQEKAIRQFERMVALVPDEPVSHYNLGVLYKMEGRMEDAIRQFETASRLDPNLAAPHFQLYNAYRQAGRREDAARELQAFQAIKKKTEGAAVPEDMEWSAYAEIYDVVDPQWSAHSSPRELKFRETALPSSVDAATARASIFDLEQDRKPDLLVWSKNGIAIYRGGVSSVQDPALASLRDVRSVAIGDFNNDSFADLAVITATEVLLLTNEKGKFRRFEAPAPTGKFQAAVWLDYDHDYDLDLILLGEDASLLRNEGAGGFSERSADMPFVKGKAIEAKVFRLVADTRGHDLLVSYEDRPAVLYRDLLLGKYRAEDLPVVPAGARLLDAFDWNNDSWVDIAFVSGDAVRLLRNRKGTLEAAGVSAPGAGFVFADLENRGLADLVSGAVILRNLGGERFAPPSSRFGDSLRWAAADFDQDGLTDLVGIRADGAIHHHKNTTPVKNTWIRLDAIGVKNLKLAPGAEVEVKAGPLYQKRLYEGLPLLLGVRAAREVDTVRITWPNGLIQNEPRQAVNQSHEYKEAQRLSGSCPIIWTWNGKEFEYITDVLGVAPLGASSGDGEYFPVDHDEYVLIKGDSLKPVKGRYEVRITEELSEVAYLDQVRLIAVDHPASIDIFHNDKWKGPPFPEFRLFGVRKRIYPVKAVDDNGRDVRSRLMALDKTYAEGFERTMTGVAKMHSLELDFGPQAASDGKAILVMSGWVDWADGSTFLSVAQEKRGGLTPPYLQVRDERGEWKTVIEDMGMPAGKPKTIVVDLTGKWLSASREVRIVTNLCLYWDEIFLSEDTAEPPAVLTDLAASEAELRFRGFSQNIIHPERRQPEMFIYGKVMPTSMWNPTPGMYTRYGDVQELLTEVDDRFVIMGSGDEIRLLFDASALPPVKEGWRRDFLLKVDGWAKDRDANTAYSQTVEPLPYHGMTRYPYGPDEAYPDTPEHRAYLEKYNTRPALRLLRPLVGDGTRSGARRDVPYGIGHE